MDQKYTTGPWTADTAFGAIIKDKLGRGIVSVLNVFNATRAQKPVPVDQDEVMANAKLVMAAPDLANTLLEVLDYFEDRQDISSETEDDGSPRPNEEMKMASAIQQALDKAGVQWR